VYIDNIEDMDGYESIGYKHGVCKVSMETSLDICQAAFRRKSCGPLT
jgi:hypothetical protein